MRLITPKDSFFLLLGDLLFFTIALWLSLGLRYLEIPSLESLESYILPYGILFILWATTFFILDLYGRKSLIFKGALPLVILRAQVINGLVATAFFYFMPFFGITPKTIMFIQLAVSSVLIFLWRWYVVNKIYTGTKESVVIIGRGEEVEEIKRELAGSNNAYHLEIVNPDKDILPDDKNLSSLLERENVSMVVMDFNDPKSATLASLLYKKHFTRINIVDTEELYEEVFDRVPLSLISDRWVLKYVSSRPKRAYFLFKKIMDFVIALVLSVVTLPIVLISMLLVKMQDGGSFFIIHDRVGKDGNLIKLIKLRTMSADDKDRPTLTNDPRITTVGSFLRKTRIDELPQLWNVLRGEVSLVGPRPELPFFVEKYQQEIPYYDLRHIIEPGLSGWAQIHYHTPAYTTATNAVKLSYELFYIKNRSLWLDVAIALKTIRTLFLRVGI